MHYTQHSKAAITQVLNTEPSAGTVKVRSRSSHTRSARSAEALYGAEHGSIIACVMAANHRVYNASLTLGEIER